MINKTHFLVILTSLYRNEFFRDNILDSASLDSATKSDLQATGIDLKNTAKVEKQLKKKPLMTMQTEVLKSQSL